MEAFDETGASTDAAPLMGERIHLVTECAGARALRLGDRAIERPITHS
jgi:hypothetical protein